MFGYGCRDVDGRLVASPDSPHQVGIAINENGDNRNMTIEFVMPNKQRIADLEKMLDQDPPKLPAPHENSSSCRYCRREAGIGLKSQCTNQRANGPAAIRLFQGQEVQLGLKCASRSYRR
jgi:hypothetical protein